MVNENRINFVFNVFIERNIKAPKVKNMKTENSILLKNKNLHFAISQKGKEKDEKKNIKTNYTRVGVPMNGRRLGLGELL